MSNSIIEGIRRATKASKIKKKIEMNDIKEFSYLGIKEGLLYTSINGRNYAYYINKDINEKSFIKKLESVIKMGDAYSAYKLVDNKMEMVLGGKGMNPASWNPKYNGRIKEVSISKENLKKLKENLRDFLNRKKTTHVCVDVTDKNLSKRIELQQMGLKYIFDHRFEGEDLDGLDKDKIIQDLIEFLEFELIPDRLISSSGTYESSDGTVYLTIGTLEELYFELEQELQYQKDQYYLDESIKKSESKKSISKENLKKLKEKKESKTIRESAISGIVVSENNEKFKLDKGDVVIRKESIKNENINIPSEILSQFPIGSQVKPLRSLKRKDSMWSSDFSNKVYTVKGYDEMPEDGILLVLNTGEDEWDYELVYTDEVVKV